MNRERITVKHLAVVLSAVVVSGFSFWWMALYTILSVADMLGIMVLIYLITLYKGFAAAERIEKKWRKRRCERKEQK